MGVPVDFDGVTYSYMTLGMEFRHKTFYIDPTMGLLKTFNLLRISLHNTYQLLLI